MKSFPLQNNVKYLIAATTSLFLLSGCQPPVVPVKNIRYSISYSVDGQEFQISKTYKCYYEDVGWISERGADWHIRGIDQPIRISGTLPDGEKYVAQPVNSMLTGASPEYQCPSTETPIASEIFVTDKEHPENLNGFDDTRIKSKDHVIKINKSMLSLDSYSMGTYKLPKDYKPQANSLGKLYYTISARFISGAEIDQDGLRNYINSRKSIWLENGQAISFTRWGTEDVEAARSFLSTKPYLYYSAGGIEITGDHTEQAWVFNRSSSTNSITWIVSSTKNKDETMIPDKNLPKDLIKFENNEIEIPTAKYGGFHFYNPRNDTLEVFYLTKTQVPLP